VDTIIILERILNTQKKKYAYSVASLQLLAHWFVKLRIHVKVVTSQVTKFNVRSYLVTTTGRSTPNYRL
jgi:hypothetical protein